MSHKFQILKVSDRELLDSLSTLAEKQDSLDTAVIDIRLSQQHSKPFSGNLSAVRSNEALETLLSSNTSVASSVAMRLPQRQNASVSVQRSDGFDEVTISFSNDTDFLEIAGIISDAHETLNGIERTETTRKILGEDAANYYQAREQALLRLEALSQRLIEENEAYRRRVDEEFDNKRAQLDAEHERRESDLDEHHNSRLQALEAREVELDEQRRDLDDRSNRHARRQDRKELKKRLAESNKNFSLTRGTSQKRFLIHCLFWVLIIATGAGVAYSFTQNFASDVNGTFWFSAAKLAASSLGFAAVVIYYIRWNDHWFRQHADEEFRLKRLDLDIDRASWFVELAMEWREEKDAPLPEVLTERLTANLFEGQSRGPAPSHPSDDLSSALIRAASGFSVPIPGVGELTLDRGGVKRFSKEAKKVAGEEA